MSRTASLMMLVSFDLLLACAWFTYMFLGAAERRLERAVKRDPRHNTLNRRAVVFLKALVSFVFFSNLILHASMIAGFWKLKHP
jgi:hypothetical protein